jgi:hypothetical protein
VRALLVGQWHCLQEEQPLVQLLERMETNPLRRSRRACDKEQRRMDAAGARELSSVAHVQRWLFPRPSSFPSSLTLHYDCQHDELE